MARTADHTARREQIAEALSLLVSEHGLDAVTVAKVAARAEISVGLVQHYFPSKDALVLFAYRRSVDAINERIAGHLAQETPQELPVAALVERGLRELIPFDRVRRAEYEVTLGFLGRCVDQPGLAEVARTRGRGLRIRLAEAITNGKECGEVAAGVDAAASSIRLLALATGLAERVHQEGSSRVGRRTVATLAAAELRVGLESVFTGRCRHYA
ncbi:MAG: TetR/AcrR family transcriptional regulator [Propionibacteriaceae bacterium]